MFMARLRQHCALVFFLGGLWRQRRWTIGSRRMAGGGPRCRAPSWEDVAAAASGARDIALGLDGLRYVAWRRAGQVVWECLSGLVWAVLGGESLAESCAATLMVYLPKIAEQREGEEVWRHVEVLRPLGYTPCTAR